MKPVIVFPIWCQEEVEHFYWMLERWNIITNVETPYNFLLACRFDFKGDTSRLEQLCNVYAPTSKVQLPGIENTYPSAPNEMWYRTMHYLYQQHKDVLFAFWMEHDVLPQQSSWLDELVRMWSTKGEKVTTMGHFEFGMINGAACYCPSVYKKAQTQKWAKRGQPWDKQLNIAGEDIMDIQCFDIRFLPIYKQRAGMSRLMTHGCKTMIERLEIYNYCFKQSEEDENVSKTWTAIKNDDFELAKQLGGRYMTRQLFVYLQSGKIIY